jgi:uncharacterized protein (TIGR02996 family)
MTPDELAFRKSIQAAPDDDLRRLVYADWLEESGHPARVARAEFIRLQIARFRQNDPTPSAREQELLHTYESIWLQQLPEGFRRGAEFRRGFLYRVRCDARTLTSPDLPPIYSPIEEMVVMVSDLGIEMETVKPQPLTIPLRVLHVECQPFLGPELLEYLARFGPYPRLEQLRIQDYGFSDEGVRGLVPEPLFPNVKTLDLSHCGISNSGAETLAESDWVGRLTELRLTGNHITEGRLAWLRHRFGSAVVV